MFFSLRSRCFTAHGPTVFSSVNDLDFSADDLNIFQPMIKMFLSQGSRKIIYRQDVQLCRRAGGLVIPPATGDSVSPGLYSILQGGIVKAKHSLCHRDIALIKLFQHTGFIQVRTLESDHCPVLFQHTSFIQYWYKGSYDIWCWFHSLKLQVGISRNCHRFMF